MTSEPQDSGQFVLSHNPGVGQIGDLPYSHFRKGDIEMKGLFAKVKHSMAMIVLSILTFVIIALVVALSPSSAAITSNSPVALPACGSDPNANTLALQQAIDSAGPGSTLALPPGVCVLAKCDIARGEICYGIAGRHSSALYIGGRSDLTLAGAADGTSVLKLDPDPPRESDGRHGYCRDVHLLSIQGASDITLRGFTVDGSDGELPEDTNQWGNGGRIAEHMHGIYVLNSTDVTIDRMNITKAHGDGLNMIANLGETNIPRTERVSVTNTNFLDNDRSGLGFQRNVGYVTVKKNYFKNSGDDQDLDMEATGSDQNLGPYQVEIDDNIFERTKPKLAVTLGSSGVQRSTGIRFTNNTIRPASTLPANQGGGCIFVYGADNTTIANNTVIGGQPCATLEARKVSGLQIRDNRFESYANSQNADGNFVPRPVIRIRDDVANRGDENCGPPPEPPCPYFIHYPEDVTITGNTIIQHVRYSPGIELNNADPVVIADNNISHTHKVSPAGNYDPTEPLLRPISVDLFFGVQNPRHGFFLNEKTVFQWWSITGNRLTQFPDSIVMAPRKATMSLSNAVVNSNIFSTGQGSPRGIWLKGAPTTPQGGFINSLTVNGNLFGCAFCGFACVPGGSPLPFAFVRPQGQSHTGNIGVCQ
jgi:Right handed beta helix region